MPSSKISNATAWYDELLGTAILVGCIACLTDTNLHVGSYPPFYLFIVVSAIGAAFGAQTGFAINPGAYVADGSSANSIV